VLPAPSAPAGGATCGEQFAVSRDAVNLAVRRPPIGEALRITPAPTMAPSVPEVQVGRGTQLTRRPMSFPAEGQQASAFSTNAGAADLRTDLTGVMYVICRFSN
jgi:hypothetical protein